MKAIGMFFAVIGFMILMVAGGAFVFIGFDLNPRIYLDASFTKGTLMSYIMMAIAIGVVVFLIGAAILRKSGYPNNR